MNESKRQKTLAKQIQRDLSEIFLRSKERFDGLWITLTEVKVSGDLGVAKIFVSGLLNGNDNERILEVIDDNKGFVRSELAKRIKNSVKHVPELRFVLDETEANAEKMDDIIGKLDIPPPMSDEELGDTYKL